MVGNQDDIKKLALDDKYPPLPHFSKENAVVYTDGSCPNNGTPLAAAGYGIYWGHGHSRNTSEILKGKRQTSQRAKIGAVNHALEQSQNDTGLLEIVSSHYVIQSVNTWSKKWVLNNWKRVDGLEVDNRDLFEITLSLIESRKGKVELIYGSDKKYSEGIEEAGKLALAGAQKQKGTSI
ncbi:ribonuclease H-like domain-containing protein [Pilaira anomala]|nr:ribonuclease H-like domain-containing protein [Pilaira anomala]